MSKIEVNKVIPRTGTTLTIGDSGDTVTLTSGAKTSGFGKIGQVVTATDSTGRSTTSTSFVTASNTLTVNITPSSTSSKVLIMATGNIYNNTQSRYTFLTIYRDSTDLGASNSKGLANMWTGGGGSDGTPFGIHIVDSPNTTSQVTYQFYFRVSGATATLNESDSKSVITAMEILD